MWLRVWLWLQVLTIVDWRFDERAQLPTAVQRCHMDCSRDIGHGTPYGQYDPVTLEGPKESPTFHSASVRLAARCLRLACGWLLGAWCLVRPTCCVLLATCQPAPLIRNNLLLSELTQQPEVPRRARPGPIHGAVAGERVPGLRADLHNELRHERAANLAGGRLQPPEAAQRGVRAGVARCVPDLPRPGLR